MINKKSIDTKEIELFRSQMKGVRPLGKKYNSSISVSRFTSSPKASILPKPAKDNDDSLNEMTSVPYFSQQDLEITAEEKLWFSKPGLQKKKVKQFKKGQLPIIGEIDLHGKVRDEAFLLLQSLFKLHPQSGVLRIIHGKGQGKPVLKNVVYYFLKQHARVLAFCSPPENQGGAGVVWVLIKRENHYL